MSNIQQFYLPYETWKIEDGYCVGQPVIWNGCEPRSHKEPIKNPKLRPIYSAPRNAYVIHVAKHDTLFKYLIVFASPTGELKELWVVTATLAPRPCEVKQSICIG